MIRQTARLGEIQLDDFPGENFTCPLIHFDESLICDDSAKPVRCTESHVYHHFWLMGIVKPRNFRLHMLEGAGIV